MSPQKRIAILGAAESGVGAAILAQKHGYDVFVSDAGRIAEVYRQQLTQRNIAFEEGSHTWSLIGNAGEVIKSPGIPDKVEIIKKIKETGYTCNFRD